MTQNKHKVTREDKFVCYFGMAMNGFLFMFLLWYIGRYGITSLVLDSLDKWKIVFNITLWYVMIMYVSDKFFESLYRLRGEHK